MNQEIQYNTNFPFTTAYQFLEDNGLKKEADDIKISQDNFKSYTTPLRRAKIIALVKSKNHFNQFLEEVWPSGKTKKGLSRTRFFENLYQRFIDFREKGITPELALMVNGPSEWYKNLAVKFKKHHKTWLQQHKLLNPDYIDLFRETIRQNGNLLVFGYVQGLGKVNYLIYADKIISDNRQRMLKPDNTVPDFARYDVIQGKCNGVRNYKYVLWLRVVHFEKIAPLALHQFISRGRRVAFNPRDMKPLHFYVDDPVQFRQCARRKQSVLSDLQSLQEEADVENVEEPEPEPILEPEVEVDVEEIEPEPMPEVEVTEPVEVTVEDVQAADLKEEFYEGERRERLTNYSGRDRQLRSRSLKIHGNTCKACGFDFEKRYGRQGKGFIEVHHLRPVSELKGETKIDPSTDMTVVCSNCHRMIHRNKNKILSLEELKALIQD